MWVGKPSPPSGAETYLKPAESLLRLLLSSCPILTMILILLGQRLFVIVGYFATMGLLSFTLATVNQPLVYELKDTLGLLGLAMLASMLLAYTNFLDIQDGKIWP